MCMISDFIASNGVTLCAPARAQGANSTDGSRRSLTKQRAAWAGKHGVRLKDGAVRGYGLTAG